MKRVLLLITVFISSCIYCQIKLPRLISDGMILQRETEVKIWGWASPNEKIELDFGKKKYNTVASNEGKWIFKLLPQKA